MEIFHFQRETNPIFRNYLEAIGRANTIVPGWEQIPFLPISFFKTHRVTSFSDEPDIIFTSSGTTSETASRHFVRDRFWYETSFNASFSYAYRNAADYAWLCLLPAYLERKGSSLVYMANAFVEKSAWAHSGFFLQADQQLVEAIEYSIAQNIPTVLMGVTFALLDFAELNTGLDLSKIIVMETGGMKGRRKELVRNEVHNELKQAFNITQVHSEYGMTELMSQAYSKGDGIYLPPPWMKVLVRSEEDPFGVQQFGAGLLCIADLANLDSCAFIETQDVGRVYQDGSFEVLGRMDNSDIRGCSLLVV